MSIIIDANEIVLPVKFIDTRFNLFSADEGHHQYLLGHIDGAIYWDINVDLSDLTSSNGRHPMPSNEQLQSLFERSGLLLDDEIVIYDQGGAPYSARAWFMLHYAGFKKVKIVNGGLEALLEAGFELTTALPDIKPSSLTIKWNKHLVASREQVREVTEGNRNAILLDARNYQRYIGEHEPIDPIPGHIPTAINFDWEQVLNEKRFAMNEVLKEHFDQNQEYIVYCGSGVTAAPLFVSLMNEDFNKLQLYVGSYSDWITAYPVAVGDESKNKNV